MTTRYWSNSTWCGFPNAKRSLWRNSL